MSQEITEEKLILTLEEQEDILGDKDINVRDPILLIFDMYKAMSSILRNKEKGSDHLKIYQSGLINAVVPQVPNYPEIVWWCAHGYLL